MNDLHIITASILVVMLMLTKSSENFESGQGFELPNNNKPVFLDMYGKNNSRDFKLMDYISKIKLSLPSIVNNYKINPINGNLHPLLIVPGLGMSCNIKDSNIVFRNNQVVDSNHVSFIKHIYGLPNYSVLLDALTSKGYQSGQNMLAVNYDYRTIGSSFMAWCNIMVGTIEQQYNKYRKRVFLFGHSLGSLLINCFLVNQTKQWKDRYIQGFITVSGAFGGCPKALRTLLSGEKGLKPDFRLYTGLQLMLPNKNVYNNRELVNYNNVLYSINNIEQLLLQLPNKDVYGVYNSITLMFQLTSILAPEVEVFSLCGDGINTESNYVYYNTPMDPPQNSFKYYKGDGTIPNFALEIPLGWGTQQPYSVRFKRYPNAEHLEILSLSESVKDIMNILW